MTVEFQQPAYYDDELLVGVRVGRIGRSSLTWEVAVFRKDEMTSLAQGEIVWVYTEMAEHSSTPLPDQLVAELRETMTTARGGS